jgi:hypothetical protein
MDDETTSLPSQPHSASNDKSKPQKKQMVDGPSPFGFVQRAFWNIKAVIPHDDNSRQDHRHSGDHIVQGASIWHTKGATMLENMEIDEPPTQKTSQLISRADDGRFHCSQCPKSYSQGSHLNRHIQGHESSQSFACTICSLTFGRRQVKSAQGAGDCAT